ncbi:hypothetical protein YASMINEVIRUS_854, partial [Yasminevirus sp. GU-2018]
LIRLKTQIVDMSRKIAKHEDFEDVDDVKINEGKIKGKTNKQNVEQFIAFWRPTDPYGYMGQWHRSNFTLTQDTCDAFPDEIKNLPLYKEQFHVLEWLIEQEEFNTAEKFMMMGKAALFRCRPAFNRMSATDDPSAQKKLGRQVTGFDDDTWNKYCCDIVKIGNYLKFTQDETLKRELKSTGSAVLIEGSPLDKIWGVGLKFDDPRIMNKRLWQGTNYLGICLMFVRDLL